MLLSHSLGRLGIARSGGARAGDGCGLRLQLRAQLGLRILRSASLSRRLALRLRQFLRMTRLALHNLVLEARELTISRRELIVTRRELILSRRELIITRRELTLSRRELTPSRRELAFEADPLDGCNLAQRCPVIHGRAPGGCEGGLQPSQLRCRLRQPRRCCVALRSQRRNGVGSRTFLLRAPRLLLHRRRRCRRRCRRLRLRNRRLKRRRMRRRSRRLRRRRLGRLRHTCLHHAQSCLRRPSVSFNLPLQRRDLCRHRRRMLPRLDGLSQQLAHLCRRRLRLRTQRPLALRRRRLQRCRGCAMRTLKRGARSRLTLRRHGRLRLARGRHRRRQLSRRSRRRRRLRRLSLARRQCECLCHRRLTSAVRLRRRPQQRVLDLVRHLQAHT